LRVQGLVDHHLRPTGRTNPLTWPALRDPGGQRGPRRSVADKRRAADVESPRRGEHRARTTDRRSVFAQVAYWLTVVGIYFLRPLLLLRKSKLFDDKGHVRRR
jgi:hypothetical protein